MNNNNSGIILITIKFQNINLNLLYAHEFKQANLENKVGDPLYKESLFLNL